MHQLDDSPFGMSCIFRTLGEDIERGARVAEEAGVRWNRDDFLWSHVQPTENQWQWESYDRCVDTLLEHGIQTVGLLCYGTPWAMSLSDDSGEPDILSMPDLDAWGRFVGRTVEHFRDRVHVWQMWNEPNIPVFWHPEPNPREYARLLVAGSMAAKEADPTCHVMGCNTSLIDLNFDRAVFEEGGWEHSDIIGVHPYRYPHAPEATDLCGDLLELAALSARFGAVKPIWITEIGYATHYGHLGSSEWWAAAMLARLYLAAWSSGLVQKICWYDYRDDGDNREYNEHNFGILRRDWAPKLAHESYSVMANTLDGFQPAGRIDLGDDLRVYRYSNGSETRLAAWTTGKNVTMPIPAPSRNVRVVRPLGHKPEFYSADRETLEGTDVVEADAPNGWVTVALDPMPVYIVPASPAGTGT